MRVRELFASARKEAPSIVFIDEIDAVAKGRDARLRSVGNDEREQTLNQLLTELDGFETDKEAAAVICIAATNRADVLDAALLRPGRFDRRVAVERPDRLGREQILRVHLGRRGLPLAPDVDVSEVASATTGFTGADLANLVNEAALLAGRRSKATVGREEFDAAVLRSVAGVEKKRSMLQARAVVLLPSAAAALSRPLLALRDQLARAASSLSLPPKQPLKTLKNENPQKPNPRRARRVWRRRWSPATRPGTRWCAPPWRAWCRRCQRSKNCRSYLVPAAPWGSPTPPPKPRTARCSSTARFAGSWPR